MDALPLIPAPPRRRWKMFRVRFLPVTVFACTLLAIGRLWSSHFLPPPLVSSGANVQATAGESSTNLVAKQLGLSDSGI